MEGCRVFDDSLWCPNSPSPSFHENCEELEEHFHQPEKKRRLKPDQVEFLEKSFEVDNKLEPDRKAELAKQVGLQPRQVAIWFQNRRARSKTKVLEREYGSLKSSYDKLKADYDALFTDNLKLKNEVNLLSQKSSHKESVKPKPELCDLDSDSPHYTDGNHSAVLDPSEFSQDEDDSFIKKSCFPKQADDHKTCFPKVEEEWYEELQPNSCNMGFPVQDEGTWFWQY